MTTGTVTATIPETGAPTQRPTRPAHSPASRSSPGEERTTPMVTATETRTAPHPAIEKTGEAMSMSMTTSTPTVIGQPAMPLPMLTPDHPTARDPRWRVVADRTARGDEGFIVAVLTTGIYCLPGCPSRTPKPENARLYDTVEEARAAGFRACLRCRPDNPGAADRGAAAVLRAKALIEAAETPPTLAELGAAVGLSPTYLQRRFKAAHGLSPRDYAAALRLRRWQDGLRDGPDATVTRAIYDAGYGSSSRAYDGDAGALGMSPRAVKAGGEGVTLRVAIESCALGWILVAGTDRGVSAVEFGESEAELRDRLRGRFPNATLADPDETFAGWVRQVAGIVEQPGKTPKPAVDGGGAGDLAGAAAAAPGPAEIPLDIRGTDFQRRVWKALRDLPLGATVSYGELAARIGHPTATRAVASACGANQVAVVIPCHRVVRADGGLGGYRWGVSRKRALLDREAEAG